MRLLVEHRCRGCHTRQKHCAAARYPTIACRARGSPASRMFGTTLVGRTPGKKTPIRAGTKAGDCSDGAVPGGCVLTPGARRVLSARVHGDTGAIEREAARQESAIAAGTLDPTAPVTNLGRECTTGSPFIGEQKTRQNFSIFARYEPTEKRRWSPRPSRQADPRRTSKPVSESRRTTSNVQQP